MIELVYEVFGSNLPDKDTFFATTANPMSLLDMRKQYKTWDIFVHEYHSFAKSKSIIETKVVNVPSTNKAVENAAE